jgi:hypothetical protein
MFTTYSPQNIVEGLGPIVHIDYVPENQKKVGQQVGLSFVVLTTVDKEEQPC